MAAERLKMNMKKIAYIVLAMLAMVSCKQNDYLDWKSLNEAWLEYNKTQPGVQTTASGLQYKQLNPSPNPTESRPNYNSTVKLDYKLYLIDSYGGYNVGELLQEGNDAIFSLQNVVQGFSEGVQKMRLHDDYVFYIPSELGYGSTATGTEGYHGYIPPYSTLIYEVHLKAMQ